MYSRGSGFCESMNLATLPLKGSLTHFKREERQIVTLLHESSLTKKLLTNIFIPQSPVTPRKTPIKEEQASGKKTQSKENILVRVSGFSSHLALLL